MTSQLQKLKTWLEEEEGYFAITLSNAQQIKNVPGKKTDPNDSRWISKLLAVGLVNGIFILPREIRELRTLSRYRDKLIGMRTSEKDRALINLYPYFKKRFVPIKEQTSFYFSL